MNENFDIYEMTEAQKALLSELLAETASKEFAEQKAKLEADVARLGGYLRGRAEETARKFGDGLGKATGAGSNKDLAG